MSSQCNFVEKFSLDGVHPPVRAHECNGWPRRGKTPSEEIVGPRPDANWSILRGPADARGAREPGGERRMDAGALGGEEGMDGETFET
jgi:hypothetical protein